MSPGTLILLAALAYGDAPPDRLDAARTYHTAGTVTCIVAPTALLMASYGALSGVDGPVPAALGVVGAASWAGGPPLLVTSARWAGVKPNHAAITWTIALHATSVATGALGAAALLGLSSYMAFNVVLAAPLIATSVGTWVASTILAGVTANKSIRNPPVARGQERRVHVAMAPWVGRHGGGLALTVGR